VPVLGPEDSIELPAGDWVELLPLVIPDRDGLFQDTRKEWKRQGSSIITMPKDGSTAVLTIPVVPRGSYELQVTFTAASAAGYVYVFLPAGDGSTALALCDRESKAFEYASVEGEPEGLDGISGLEAIDGKFAAKNSTARRITLQAKTPHMARLTVNRDDDRDLVTITAKLDGTQILRWAGKQEALLAVHQRHKKHLGLAAREMPVSFGSVRLKMLSGKAYAELPAKRQRPPKAGKGRIKIRRIVPR